MAEKHQCGTYGTAVTNGVKAAATAMYIVRMANNGKDSSVVTKTEKFGLPLQKKKNGEYKIPSGNLVYTCFTSDFLIEDADEWRAEAWEMMRIGRTFILCL